MSRSKINLLTGILYQVINTALGLFLPYLFITNLGSEANGLLNSVGQLFICLGLLEAGVGTATLQALYKPLSENDQQSISSIISATNKYYIKTGLIYSASVIVLGVIYPFLVDSELSGTTIRLVILLQGAGQVVSYFVQAKYTILLQAEGKNYIINALMLAESILRNAGKIIALSLGYGIVAVQFVHFLTLVLQAVVITTYIHQKYKWLNLKAEPNYQAISQKNSVLIQSIAWMVFNHTDILVLTVFSRNLALVSVYSVYLLVFEAIQNITNVVRNSFQYKIGFLFQKSKDDLTNYYAKYSTIIYAFSFAVFGIAYVLSTPFVKLYTAQANDIDYMLRYLPELFFIYKLMYSIRATNRQIVEAGGYFKQTQHISLIEAIMNLVVSIILASFFDIYGVLIGTVVALLYSTIAYSSFVKNNAMAPQYRKAMRLQLLNAVCVVLLIFVCQTHSLEASGYIDLVAKAVFVTAIIAAVFAGICLIQLFLLKQNLKINGEGDSGQ